MQRTAESTTPSYTGERSATGETETTQPGTKHTLAHKSDQPTKQERWPTHTHAVFEQHVIHTRDHKFKLSAHQSTLLSVYVHIRALRLSVSKCKTLFCLTEPTPTEHFILSDNGYVCVSVCITDLPYKVM